jgi:hypothetical protein
MCMNIARTLVGILVVSACSSNIPEPECSQNLQCGPGFECRLGACRAAVKDPPNSVDSGLVTDSGQPADTADGGEEPLACAGFGACQIGQRCSNNTDCLTRFCTDGVCCNEQCAGTCGRCNAAGSVGVCKAKPKDSECGAYRCDGTSFDCPTSCMSVAQCSYASACCLPLADGYGDCNAKGLAQKCFEQPACITLTDTFDGDILDPTRWQFSSEPGAVSVVENQLALSPVYDQPSNTGYAIALRSPRCSLVNNAVTVEVKDITSMRKAASLSAVQLSAFERFTGGRGSYQISVLDEFSRPGPELEAEATFINEDAGTFFSPKIPYNAVTRRFIRLSEDAGQIVYSASADGKVYTSFGAVPVSARPSDVEIAIAVYQEKPLPDAGVRVLLDNFNVVP